MTLKFPASGGREALIPTCLPFSKIEYCATSTIQTLFSVLYAMGHEPIQVERWDLCSPKDFFVERPASLVISKSLFMYSLKSLSSLFHLLSAALTWLSIAPEWGRKSFVTTQICHLFVGKWYESKLLGKSFVSLQTMTPTWSLVLSV